MKIIKHITLGILAAMLCFGMTACTSHEDASQMNADATSGTSKLKLTIHIPTEDNATRAVPQGGDEGDGEETGVRNEDKLREIVAFGINDADGINAPSETTFAFRKHIRESEQAWEIDPASVKILLNIDDYELMAGDRIVVVANAGSLSGITTVGALRDYISYSPFTGTVANADNFVMSSAKSDDGVVAIGADGYLQASVKVQRTVARIDYMYNSTDNYTAPSEFTYVVHSDPDNMSSSKIATVHITNIIPINVMQKPSYLIKRVAEDFVTTPTYCGIESTDANHIPTNYVIEPQTLAKESEVDAAKLDSWYGSTRAATVTSNISAYLENSAISKYNTTITPQKELNYYTHYVTIAYANENTQSSAQHKPKFMTGLLLRGIYEPGRVYTNAEATTIYSPMSDYTTGRTFWRYSPTKSNMREADCLYFDNEAAANGYKTAHPEDMAVVTEFTNGICYYTAWLRHANSDADPHLSFPMEYGIVRNNIYRIGARKFTGPGTPSPVLNSPEHADLRIFVRPWNRRENSEIIL